MFDTFKLAVAIASTALFLSAAGANAGPINLITNGSFETSTGAGQIGYNTTVTGWSNLSNGYNFLFTPGSADNGTGVAGQYGNLQLWGPGNGSANGLTASPDGGNFIGEDGAFQTGAITQTVSGLTVGAQYAVSFYFAGAQQYNFNGPTTEQFLVSLGSETLATNVLSDVTNGFTGWQQVTMTFTADSTSDVLSFLAVGTPNGEPPFSLLDGVSMTTVPEPASMTIMGSGLALMGLIRRRRKK